METGQTKQDSIVCCHCRAAWCYKLVLLGAEQSSPVASVSNKMGEIFVEQPEQQDCHQLEEKIEAYWCLFAGSVPSAQQYSMSYWNVNKSSKQINKWTALVEWVSQTTAR